MDVKELRLSLGVSRAEFADAVGASPALVQSWELGRRQPSGVASKILMLLQRNPRLLNDLRAIKPNSAVN